MARRSKPHDGYMPLASRSSAALAGRLRNQATAYQMQTPATVSPEAARRRGAKACRRR